MLLGQLEWHDLVAPALGLIFGLGSTGITWLIKRANEGSSLEVKEAVKDLNSVIGKMEISLRAEINAVRGEMAGVNGRLASQEVKMSEMGANMAFFREEQTRYRDHLRRNDEHVQQLSREVARLQGGLVLKPVTLAQPNEGG